MQSETATKRPASRAAKQPPAPPAEPAAKPPEPQLVQLDAIFSLAQQGKAEVLPLLRKALDEHPEIVQEYGSLAGRLQSLWLNLVSPTNHFLRETTLRFMKQQRAALAGPDASPLEELLAERIIAIHLQVMYFEGMTGKSEGKSGDKTMDYLHRRCDEANRRLREAITTLARVRKLLPRPIQVQVAVSGKVEATVKTRRSRRKGRQTTRGRTAGRNRLQNLLSGSRSIN